jgi:hypothetical protein
VQLHAQAHTESACKEGVQHLPQEHMVFRLCNHHFACVLMLYDFMLLSSIMHALYSSLCCRDTCVGVGVCVYVCVCVRVCGCVFKQMVKNVVCLNKLFACLCLQRLSKY